MPEKKHVKLPRDTQTYEKKNETMPRNQGVGHNGKYPPLGGQLDNRNRVVAPNVYIMDTTAWAHESEVLWDD